MPKVKTLVCETENLIFSYEVSVDKEGLFSTTIPRNVVEELERVGIDLNMNRLHHKGFFSDVSLEGLKAQVFAIVKKFSAKELVVEKVVLRYSVDTVCCYCKTEAGVIVPNGYWKCEADGKRGGDGCVFFDGSKKNDGVWSMPYGFSCYVKPKVVKVWKFPDGKTTNEYFRVDDERLAGDNVLYWLDSLVNMGCTNFKEVDYSPEIGLFFKGVILYVCNLNERLRKVFGESFDVSKVDFNKIGLLGFKDSEVV